jgi:hypothetical protein
MLAVATLFGGKVYSPAQLTALADADAPAANADLPACLTELRARFDELATSTGDSPDKLAKGSALVDHILPMAFPAPPPAATPSSN